MPPPPEPRSGPRVGLGPLAGAVLSVGLSAALFLSTRCPEVYWYDSAEYVAAAVTLGIPHPPGYPLYTLIAHAFTWLPGSPASGVNALSSVSGAIAVGLAYALGLSLGASPLTAFTGAALLAVTPVLWLNATIAEVYAPGLCFALGVWLLLSRAERRGSTRLLAAAAALAGLGLGVHYSLATLGLGYAWVVARTGPAGPRATLRRLAVAAGATLLGACIFLYIPLRAAQEPAINQASPLTAARLLWLFLGGNYGGWFGDGAGRPEVAPASALLTEVPVPLVLIALLGLWALWRRRRTLGVGLGLAIAGNLLFFHDYRVHDLEVFLLPTVALLSVLVGVGLSAATDAALARPGLGWLPTPVVAGLLAFVLVRVDAHYTDRDLGDFAEARRYAERVEDQLPRQAVIVTYTTPAEWKYHAVFGMYWQKALGRRPDVIVVKNLPRRALDRLLAEARRVYLYVPVEHVAAEYELRPEGALTRVVARRVAAPPGSR